MSAAELLAEVEQTAGNNPRKALRLLFSRTIFAGDPVLCEDLLRSAEPSRLGVLCAAGLAAATNPQRNLPSRLPYMQKLAAFLREVRPADADLLLLGLW